MKPLLTFYHCLSIYIVRFENYTVLNKSLQLFLCKRKSSGYFSTLCYGLFPKGKNVVTKRTNELMLTPTPIWAVGLFSNVYNVYNGFSDIMPKGFQIQFKQNHY